MGIRNNLNALLKWGSLVAGGLVVVVFTLLLLQQHDREVRWGLDIWHQEQIAKSMVAFYGDNQRLPNSIEEIVRGGYLPETGSIFASPLHYEKVKEIHYSVSSYRITPIPQEDSLWHYVFRVNDPENLRAESGFYGVDSYINEELGKRKKQKP